jgi:hypothetical protein
MIPEPQLTYVLELLKAHLHGSSFVLITTKLPDDDNLVTPPSKVEFILSAPALPL